MRWLFVCILLLGGLAGCSSDNTRCAVPSGENVFVDSGQSRVFRIAVPDGASRDTPMVVSMHGATGSAGMQEEVTGFSDLGAQQGFIALYPEGLGAGSEKYWDAQPRSADVRYVADLVRSLHADGCSQPSRTYLTGFSMGAMMVSRLLCEEPGIAGGAAMVGGVLPPEPGCRIDKRMPVIVFHGRDDRSVPFDGSLPAGVADWAGGPQVSSYPGVTREAMTGMWAAAKGCDRPVTQTVSEPGETTTVWTGCGDSATVLHVYEGTAHTWDATNPRVPRTSTQIWEEMPG